VTLFEIAALKKDKPFTFKNLLIAKFVMVPQITPQEAYVHGEIA
jgi:hypothetical protein